MFVFNCSEVAAGFGNLELGKKDMEAEGGPGKKGSFSGRGGNKSD